MHGDAWISTLPRQKKEDGPWGHGARTADWRLEATVRRRGREGVDRERERRVREKGLEGGVLALGLGKRG